MANMVGMEAADLTNLGAAPVAPALPSMVIKSGWAYIATSRSASILPAANLTPIGFPSETSPYYIKSTKLTLFCMALSRPFNSVLAYFRYKVNRN